MNCIRIALSTSTDTSRYSKLKKLNLAWCGCRFNSTLASKFWRIYPTHCHFVFDFLVQNLLRNCIPLVSQWDVTWCTKFHRILMCCGTNSGAAVPCHKGQCWDALCKGLSWRPYGHKTMLFGERGKAYLKYVMCMHIHILYVIICIWI